MVAFREAFIPMPLDERAAIFTNALRSAIATHLEQSEDSISVDLPFEAFDPAWTDLGTLWVFMRTALQVPLGVPVYAYEVAECRSIKQLSQYLATEMDWPPPPEGQVEDLQGGNWRWGMPGEPPAQKLPSAAYILSSPRSGSTLLRTMLANHPALFVPGEINLLNFERMGTRRELTERWRQPWMRIGTQIIWQQLNTTPTKSLEQLEDEDAPTQEVYGIIQAHCGGKLLIDKSPANAADLAWLRRAESIFDAPKYIHLVRHPNAAIESYVRMRFIHIVHDYFHTYDTNPWLAAEKFWDLTNHNILSLLNDVDDNRKLTVHYEELVTQPARVLQRISEFLGFTYDPSMADPYSGKATQLRGIGDPNWAFRQQIDPTLANAWRTRQPPQEISPITRDLATRLGYTL